MSIRLRLILSYAAMLVVPVVLMFITVLLLVVVFRGDLQNLHDMYGEERGQSAFWRDERLIEDIGRTAETDPARLSQADYLAETDRKLAPNQAGLIVREGDRLTYISESVNLPELTGQLSAFKHPGYRDEHISEKLGGKVYSVGQYDYLLPDQTQGSVFVVTSLSPFANFARKFFPVLFLLLVVILVLTHTALTFFMSRSIIRPLNGLRHAVKQIKEGNLDFQVEVSGKDEIGQLGVAFEEMRAQLKSSIETQLQYEENRKELVTNISHDLKTPITAIKGYVEGIQDGIADTPEKMKKYINTIYAKSVEMDRLIDELFLYSKLDLKRLPFAFERVDMADFLQDCSEDLRFDLEKTGFRFRSEIALQPGTWVSLDRDKFIRVIHNVIRNCVNYMDKDDKRIALQASETDGAVLIRISDNGPGIDAAALPHIFDRFYRAEQSRNSETGGSGLGLAIVKQIIEGHGGEIWAESAEGEGTTIFMALKKLPPAGGKER
ncbi:sensor histidine kinase [Paenibacillus contaminans]|uniref:histidine kinase n=1 Tax=Paenibacillus contaminans TaxID=450362 RepID=A0A329MCM9_9BACL|nr:ATP-binding protein [Paenibacillus contaminans]RAV16393.1 sensor histidine kinase [Paenibacillus contaminans]